MSQRSRCAGSAPLPVLRKPSCSRPALVLQSWCQPDPACQPSLTLSAVLVTGTWKLATDPPRAEHVAPSRKGSKPHQGGCGVFTSLFVEQRGEALNVHRTPCGASPVLYLPQGEIQLV